MNYTEEEYKRMAHHFLTESIDTISAIKALRGFSGLPLKEALRIVNLVKAEAAMAKQEELRLIEVKKEKYREDIQEYSNFLVRVVPFEKINSVRKLKDQFNLSLKEAHDYIKAAQVIHNLDKVAEADRIPPEKEEYILFVKMYEYSDPIEYKVSSKEEARNIVEVLKKATEVYDFKLFQEVFHF